MIIGMLFVTLLILFCTTYWIISKIVQINNIVKKITLDTYFLEQKIVISADKINRILKPVKKTKNKNSIKFIDIFLMSIDLILTYIYKNKYEKLKDYYEFFKNTMA